MRRSRAILAAVSSLFLATMAAPAVSSRDTPARPLYYEQTVSPEDLEGRTLRELALMRNWIFARAGNPFRRAWLREFFEAQPWYRPSEALDPARLTDADRRNADAIARFELDLNRKSLVTRRDSLLALGNRTAEDRIELEILAERLGEWRPSDPGVEPNPLQDSRLLDRQLTLEQLADFSRRDLALLRNAIYARHGRPFRSEFLKLYFLRFEWYAPDPKYSDRRLTRIDRRNLKLVKSLENELGGPLGTELESFGFA